VARNAEAAIPLEKLPACTAVQLSTTHPAANRACDLRIPQMWRVHLKIAGQDTPRPRIEQGANHC
jgi:hypothetical protein